MWRGTILCCTGTVHSEIHGYNSPFSFPRCPIALQCHLSRAPPAAAAALRGVGGGGGGDEVGQRWKSPLKPAVLLIYIFHNSLCCCARVAQSVERQALKKFTSAEWLPDGQGFEPPRGCSFLCARHCFCSQPVTVLSLRPPLAVLYPSSTVPQ